MKYSFRDLLSLSSAESKGVIVLIVIIIIITGIQAFLNFHTPARAPGDDSVFIKEIRQFEKYLSIKKDIKDTFSFTSEVIPYEVIESPESFYFDPNNASAGDLRRLGMNNKLIRTIFNYRLHGGKFYHAAELMKIYGMPEEVYERLAPYVKISASADKPQAVLENPAPIPIDINLADSATLLKIYGIGPVLARRIIRYRNLLGGFYATEQLKEVYGIPDSVILKVERVFFADTSTILRLNLNLATESEMARHPYIGKYHAKGIIKYRTMKQRIQKIDELRSNGLIPGESFERLKKYLTI